MRLSISAAASAARPEYPRRNASSAEALDSMGAYFVGNSPLDRAATDIAARLREMGIGYAIAGALSIAVHGFKRVTEDVDVLITREGLDRFKERWLGRGYVNLRPGG